MKNFSHLRIDGFSDCHVQGIAIDKVHEFMYFSFTTSLIKTDLAGNVLGSVKGIIGHLGCLAYNYQDGKVYASLEYNDDDIGMGILRKINKKIEFPNSFYIAVFDANKITRIDMDAEKDGIMTAIFLKEVCDDYSAIGHRYGCSGIDGVTFAPVPGEEHGNNLYVAYGIYSDVNRCDNDYQILLRYDMNNFINYAKPLNQVNLHKSGPSNADDRYFIFTGNTNYGIQNLEYDSYNKCLFAAVYKGRKAQFPNYRMFAFDIEKSCCIEKLKGIDESGKVLQLKKLPFFESHNEICGCNFEYGSTGMISLGNNNYLFSEEFKNENGYGTDVYSYKLYPDAGFVKEEIDL